MTTTQFHPARWSLIAAVLAVLSGILVVTSFDARAAGETSKVVVSLTWDDGRASQDGSLAIQQAHGMKATYYINSAMIGSSPYYLSRQQLDGLAAAGNEIGGHTDRHEDLSAITVAEATGAICDDRQTLATWYGDAAIRSFAYPFGISTVDVEKIPQSCGYTSARDARGLRTATTCLGCRIAESLPPLDPRHLAAVPSITSSTTLGDLQFQVDQAASSGGGWVIYTLHSLGDPANGYSIDPALYDSFLTWLGGRSDVEVRTVGDVMSTTWPSPTTTTTTPAPPPPPSTPVALVNADLEIDANANGVSDCWLRGSAGTNTATWRRTADAHGGSAAEEVTITAFTSGDRKLVQLLDNGTANGGCAPSVSDANTYTVGVWYRSTGKSNIVVFTRDSAGVWKYWRTGPVVSPSASWAQTTFAPGRLPSGTTAISYGLALASAGTLTTDDYSMSKDGVGAPALVDPAVKNSSFENDSNNDGLADCWFRGGYGISSFTYDRVPDAHSGTWGQRLRIPSLSSGDRKIVQPLDSGQAAGGCAIDVTPGRQYALGAWYHSDATPLLFIYLRDAAGSWRWWISTFPMAASSGWTRAAYTTPPIPAGTSAMSFGLGLTGAGTLVMDDASAAPM